MVIMRKLITDDEGKIVSQKPCQLTFQTVRSYHVKAALLGSVLGKSFRGIVEDCLDRLWEQHAPTRVYAEGVNRAFGLTGGVRKVLDLDTPGVEFRDETEQMLEGQAYLRSLGIPETHVPTEPKAVAAVVRRVKAAQIDYPPVPLAQMAQPGESPLPAEVEIVAALGQPYGDGPTATPPPYPLFDLEAMEERERAAMTPDFPEL